MTELYKEFQDRFIAQNTGFSKEVIDAYYSVPRHMFVPYLRDYPDKWITITDENLEEYLSILYADHPLAIFGDEQVISTISQPSFVLTILDFLELKPGHKVFELGSGSGWNAALMGHIIGKDGRVVSIEIIPELVDRANACLDRLHIKNVKIMQGDATEGYIEDAPYDRAIFTAGAYDLPAVFHKQLGDGAVLIFVLKGDLNSDILYVLKKNDEEGCFISTKAVACSFVPVTTTTKHKITEFNHPMALTNTLRIYPNNKEIDITCRHMMKQNESTFVWL